MDCSMDPEAIYACVISMAVVALNFKLYIFEGDLVIILKDKKTDHVSCG